MRSLAAALLLLPLLAGPLRAQERPEDEEGWRSQSCTTHCHGKETTAFEHDVHRAVLDCVHCHGGDPTAQRDKAAAHAADAGFRGVPARDSVPAMCGECHSDARRMVFFDLPTDQLALYRTSGHGRAVLDEGRLDAAVCTDCHHAHGVLPSHDRRAPTAPINQPATCGACHDDPQRAEIPHSEHDPSTAFTASVHGHVLLDEDARGAPSCADCHGSHGAAPPGVREVVQVCSHCHESTAEAYRHSPHHASGEMSCSPCHTDEEPGFDRSGCAACHGAHRTPMPDETMYLGDAPGHCGHCHREPGPAREFIATVRQGQRELREAMRRTHELNLALKERGLFLENEESFLRESQRALVTGRVKAHAMDAPAMERHFADGLRRQERAREMIEKKQRVLRDRLLLLGGAAFVLLLMLGLLGVKLSELRKLQ